MRPFSRGPPDRPTNPVLTHEVNSRSRSVGRRNAYFPRVVVPVHPPVRPPVHPSARRSVCLSVSFGVTPPKQMVQKLNVRPRPTSTDSPPPPPLSLLRQIYPARPPACLCLHALLPRLIRREHGRQSCLLACLPYISSDAARLTAKPKAF